MAEKTPPLARVTVSGTTEQRVWPNFAVFSEYYYDDLTTKTATTTTTISVAPQETKGLRKHCMERRIGIAAVGTPAEATEPIKRNPD